MSARKTRMSVAVAGVLVVAAVSASSAGAAVTIGEIFTPTVSCNGAGQSFLTSISPAAPAASHAAPSGGVITQWSFQAGATPPGQLRLKVYRGAAPNFTVVDAGPLEAPTASQLNTFPAHIPVQAGDLIGFFGFGTSAYQCGRAATGYTIAFSPGDVPTGTAPTYNTTGGAELSVSARLEPDADNDGFGDETEDACPTDAATRLECVPPETTITKKPAAKIRRKRATFEFTSSEENSTFECSLNGAAFAACTSPETVNGKKGKNTFSVRAKDAAGNVDPTPATATWKFKKKKKH